MSEATSFESSTLWPAIKEIVAKGGSKILYDYKGRISTQSEDIPVWDMNAIEYYRDYLNDIGEAVRVTFKVGLGDYVKRIYPYRNNMEFTIKKTPLEEGGSSRAKDQEAQSMRYKVIFNTAKNPEVTASEIETYDYNSLNAADMVELNLELVDRSLEPLRIKTTGGVFQNVTLENVIRTVLGSESAKVLVDGKPACSSVELVKPDNSEIVPHVVLPHGKIKIANVPTFLQINVGGVYNRGLGTYFQYYKKKKSWFVYPTYDTIRFNQGGPKAIFYAVPQERLPQLDKSYWEDGDLLKIIVTAQRMYKDSAEINLMNSGSGYRMPDARSFMKKPVKITSSGPMASRGELNHEVAFKEREDGLNFAPVADSPGSNPFLQRSMVAANTLARVDLVWENGDPDLIFPGMPCKYTYLSDGKVLSLTGTILFVHSLTSRKEKFQSSAYRTITRITIACEPQQKTPTLPKQGAVGET